MKKSMNKYIPNVGWPLFEKFLKMVLGLFVGVYVARYLGPEDFGYMNYIFSYVALFSPFFKLGLDGIISRDIAKSEGDINEILVPAFFLKLTSGIIITMISTLYIYLFKSEFYLIITFIVSSLYIIKSFEVVEFYFRGKVKQKIVAISYISAILISSVVKLVTIILDAGLIFIVISNAIEVIVSISIMLFYFLKENVNINISSVRFESVKTLLKESWPLIFSGVFVQIYLNVDKVMLEHYLGASSVGHYSAASRISSIWYLIPITICWSFQPAIVKAKMISSKLYNQNLYSLFLLMTFMSYVIIIPVYIFSEQIINILFGDEYYMASDILRIHILSSLFVFIGAPRGLWITNESIFKFSLFSNVLAGLLNIVLNVTFIPSFGGVGAAYSTLVSYAVANIISGFLYKPVRQIAKMQVKSLFLIDAYKNYKKVLTNA